MATLDDYRNNTGEFAPEQEEQAPDAEVHEQEEYVEQEQIDDEPIDDGVEVQEPEEDDLPPLQPKEQTAFEKRMEREARKIEERLRKQLEGEVESKYSRHNQIIQKLGGDPDAIERRIQEQELQAQANRLADQYGWDDSQVQYYVQQEQAKIEQTQLQRELQELRISNEINDLQDRPEFNGIKAMKKEIVALVSKSNGTLTPEQAYWALGGSQRAAQNKREAEQRAAFQRRTGRVVASDAPTAASTEQAIPANVLAEAKRWGLSEKEIRELAEFDASNIQEYRQKKKAK